MREKIGADPEPAVQRIREELDAAQKEAAGDRKASADAPLAALLDCDSSAAVTKPPFEVDTAAPEETIAAIGDSLVNYPAGFHVHPKVKKLLEQRVEMAHGQAPHRFRNGRSAGLRLPALQGVPVRLSGQDSRRGTFNQRHAASNRH